MRNYTKRSEKEYNWVRSLFANIISHCVYGLYYRIWYRLEIQGRENIDKSKTVIVAPNHLSAVDPFITSYALNWPIAFMAKNQLFEKFWSRLFMDLLGAFSVNREKLEVSTIKTALAIKKTNWALGLFPQGTREKAGKITQIQKGFAALAKTMKVNILPVAIINADKKSILPFKEKVIIKIGKEIPYNDDLDLVVEQWKNAIVDMTGFEYAPNENVNIKK